MPQIYGLPNNWTAVDTQLDLQSAVVPPLWLSQLVGNIATALDQEGFEDVSAAKIVAGFARHLMIAIDAWQTGEFAEVEREFLTRLPRESGVIRKLDDKGDLLIRRVSKAETRRHALLPALATPSWLDTDTLTPKLSIPKLYGGRP